MCLRPASNCVGGVVYNVIVGVRGTKVISPFKPCTDLLEMKIIIMNDLDLGLESLGLR